MFRDSVVRICKSQQTNGTKGRLPIANLISCNCFRLMRNWKLGNLCKEISVFESTESYLSHFVEAGLLQKKFQILPTFSQNVTLQEAFETVAQINEELKRTELDGAFCKKKI